MRCGIRALVILLFISYAQAADEFLIKLSAEKAELLRQAVEAKNFTYQDSLFGTGGRSGLQTISDTGIPARWFLLRSDNLKESELPALQLRGEILDYQPNHILKIYQTGSDPLQSRQWYLEKIRAVQAAAMADPSRTILVSVIDTGIDYRHEDLQGRLWVNDAEDLNHNGTLDSSDVNGVDDDGNGYIDDVFGWDFVDAPRFPDGGDFLDPDNDPMDEFQSGHGTPVAGLIAAATENGTGIRGIAANVKVMNLRAGTASGYLEEDDVARAILYAVNNGADIINMSFGDVVVSPFLRDVIRYAWSEGVVIVAAAGNSGTNEIHYPAGYPETIAVAATDQSDNRAGFSTWGTFIDLAAPGVEIFSTAVDDGYASFNGTSFSAPIVCAAAAVLLGENPELNSEQVRNTLKTSSDDLGGFGFDPLFGAGRLNMLTMIKSAYQTELTIHSPAAGSSVAEERIPVVVTATMPDLFSVSLFYGMGDEPQQWITLQQNWPFQVVEDTLAIISSAALPDTLITLRLVAESLDRRLSENRAVFRLDRTVPQITNIRHDIMLESDGYLALIQFETDDICTAELQFRAAGSEDGFRRRFSKYETKTHRIIIEDSSISGPVEYKISATNRAGLNAGDDNDGALFSFLFPSEPVNSTAFIPSTLELPPGYLMPTVTDFDDDGYPEVVMSRYDVNNAFGLLQIFEFGTDNFEMAAQTSFKAIPRDVGDSDGDGFMEIMTGFGSVSVILEADSSGGFPQSKIIWKDSSFWASRFISLNNGLTDEILGRRDGGNYTLLRYQDWNFYQPVFEFTNPTPGLNQYGPPITAFGDLNNNGNMEIVFTDYDGDVLIYEHDGYDSFQLLKTFRHPIKGNAPLPFIASLYSSDVENLILATHSAESRNYEHEFDGRFWQYDIYEWSDADSLELRQSIKLFGYVSERDFDAGAGIIGFPGESIQRLTVNAYPDLYLFESDGVHLKPVWHEQPSAGNTAIAADFNQDGTVEMLYRLRDKFRTVNLAKSDRPPRPGHFSAYPLDTATVQLSWQAVSDAESFLLYRGTRENELLLIDSVAGRNRYTDDNVRADSLYFYAVRNFSSRFAEPYGPLSEVLSVRPNSPPRVDSLRVVNDGQLQLFFNEKMDAASLTPGRFRLKAGGTAAGSVVAFRDGEACLVSFGRRFNADSLEFLQIGDIRDLLHTPLDGSQRSLPFQYREEDVQPFVESWQITGGHSLQISFNVPMNSTTVLAAENYSLQPAGRVGRVENLDAGAKVYELFLEENILLGVGGQATIISMNNLRSLAGKPFVKGSVLAVHKQADNLKNMYLYPQPATFNGGAVTFANVRSNTEITIFDLNGTIVRKLRVNDNSGGVVWNLKNQQGRTVSAGIYLFLARSQNEQKTGKLTVIR